MQQQGERVAIAKAQGLLAQLAQHALGFTDAARNLQHHPGAGRQQQLTAQTRLQQQRPAPLRPATGK